MFREEGDGAGDQPAHTDEQTPPGWQPQGG